MTVSRGHEPRDRLAMATKHVRPTLNGTKTLTARYDFEREYRPGHQLVLETPDGEPFATACVERVETMTVKEFVAAAYEGHRTYRSIDEFLDELHGYYPEATLSGETPLTVIWFSDVSEIGGGA